MHNVTREQARCLAHDLQQLLKRKCVTVYLFGNAVAHDAAQDEEFIHLLLEVTFDQFELYGDECDAVKDLSGWWQLHLNDESQFIPWERSPVADIARTPSVIKALGIDKAALEALCAAHDVSLGQCEILCLPCDWRAMVSITAGQYPPVMFGYDTDELTTILCEAIRASALR